MEVAEFIMVHTNGQLNYVYLLETSQLPIIREFGLKIDLRLLYLTYGTHYILSCLVV